MPYEEIHARMIGKKDIVFILERFIESGDTVESDLRVHRSKEREDLLCERLTGSEAARREPEQLPSAFFAGAAQRTSQFREKCVAKRCAIRAISRYPG